MKKNKQQEKIYKTPVETSPRGRPVLKQKTNLKQAMIETKDVKNCIVQKLKKQQTNKKLIREKTRQK